MILDTFQDVTLKQALFERFGLPVFVVLWNGELGKSRRSQFYGETAYADAQRLFGDLVLERMYN